MNTRLTLGDARNVLEGFATASTFESVINQVSERYIYNGKWKGNMIRVVIPTQELGYITLPVEYLAALGSTYNHWPTPIMGEFHNYFESGPGTPASIDGWYGQLQDLGDGYCTQRDITELREQITPQVAASPGSIVLYSTGSDNGKSVRLYGIQEETGLPVTDNQGYDGEEVVLNAPFVVSQYHYTKLTDVLKASTRGPVSAWVRPTGGGADYQIAVWQPFEMSPRYRRYMVGRTTKGVELLCQRRYTPIRAETDWVIPGSIAALKWGMKAVRYEDTGYNDNAAAAWEMGVNWLNQEATASRGGAQPSMPSVLGWGTPIPQTW